MRTLSVLASISLVVAMILLSGATTARGQAGARHTHPRVTPRVRQGRVVGARIRTNLAKQNYMYESVQVVLLTTGNLPPSERTRSTSTAPHRLIVGGIGEHANSPYVRFRSAPQPVPNWDNEVTIDVDYGDGPNDLRPGERVELATPWTPGD